MAVEEEGLRVFQSVRIKIGSNVEISPAELLETAPQLSISCERADGLGLSFGSHE